MLIQAIRLRMACTPPVISINLFATSCSDASYMLQPIQLHFKKHNAAHAKDQYNQQRRQDFFQPFTAQMLQYNRS